MSEVQGPPHHYWVKLAHCEVLNIAPPFKPAPVKLSRERWEMLYRDVGIKHAVDSIRLAFPAEIDGVIFLPAEYVLAESRTERELLWQAVIDSSSHAYDLMLEDRSTLYGTPPR